MKIGDIKIVKSKDYEKYMWIACIDCGKEKWVRVRKGKPENINCRSCGAKKVYNRAVILYPIRSMEEAYIQDYGKDLENCFDLADRTIYKNRVFCRDCPDFNICMGRFWEYCPIRAEVLEIIK